MVFFLLMFFSFGIIISLVIGFNVYAVFGSLISNKVLFWTIVVAVSQCYVLVRVLTRAFNMEISGLVLYITSTIFALTILVFTTAVFMDIIFYATKYISKLNFIHSFAISNPIKVGLLGAFLVLLQFGLGIINANVTRVTEYNIVLDKLDDGENIRIVQLSDLHVTNFTSVKALEKTVMKINSLKPDIVVITGDTIDAELEPYINKDINGILSNIESNYGTYIIFGNHEYYSGPIKNVEEVFRKSNMHFMRDDVVYIEGLGITLVGRDDPTKTMVRVVKVESKENGNKIKIKPRAKLSTLLRDQIEDRPIVVLDHQPLNKHINEAINSKVDLMLSGHTHNGQFFPFDLVMKFIFVEPWGLYKEGKFNLIVSCGYGTWGPPIRTRSYSEIVLINIRSSQ